MDRRRVAARLSKFRRAHPVAGPPEGPSNRKAGGGFFNRVQHTPTSFCAAPARSPGASTAALSAVAGCGTPPFVDANPVRVLSLGP